MATEHRTTLPLRWRDIDGLGHLNQSVYHELLEEARAAFIAARLGGGEAAEHWVLARVELDYRHEVRHEDGSVDVVVRVGRIGRSSMTLDHQVLLPGGRVAAEGNAVMVAWDPARRAARPLTEGERTALAG